MDNGDIAAPGEFLILIVEDTAIERVMVRSALKNQGYRIAEAEDGIRGLEMAKALQPDLLIMDVMMPSMDGFTACGKLREDPVTAHLPVLMMTGLDDQASIEKAFKAGATGFVTKPINHSLLGHHVRYILRASKLEHELRVERDRAEAASQAKSHFLANVSHELRTPLNAIIGFSEFMKDGSLGSLDSDKQAEFTSHIFESGTQLLKIVNDILDVSAIEFGNLEIFFDRFEISEMVRKIHSQLEPGAKEAGVELHCVVEPDFPPINSDERRLTQALMNLVRNAIKFTPSGGDVTLRAAMSETSEVVISVTDSGIGIPEAAIDTALDLFGQVEVGHARKYGGLGLGLPLAKSILEALGGQLSVKSEPGHGTVATIRLPASSVVVPGDASACA